MTAPVLAHKKFYIIKPAEGRNQIKNPQFSPPDFGHDWLYSGGVGGTLESTGDHQRRGAYCLQVNPVTGAIANAYYNAGLTVEDEKIYTFSADIKGVEGQSMRIYITDKSGWPTHAYTDFTATGYWQRPEVTWEATGNSSTISVVVQRKAIASTAPFYVDGAQFEQASAATTLIEGYMPGCRWEGYARNSASIRSAQYGLGGEIVDLEDYCHVVQVTGLGHGDWNQILTKMTSGGDMYQTHIRKSRQFSIIVDFIGNSLREIEANRKAVIDLLRPDRLRGQEMIVRYQGVDVNGVEATNPVDIVCAPLPATLTDTPDLPTYQREVLNFKIPSGLLNGAYNDGAELDLYADFPAEHIVKRDPDGNWCKWTGSAYQSLITGLNGNVYCMAEAPDGKIYVGGSFTDAGGVANADYLARWNPVSEEWEAVVAGINNDVNCMDFDANGDLYIGGSFTDLGSAAGDRIAKITDLSGTPTVNVMGTGLTGIANTIAVSADGDVYVGGNFASAGGAASTSYIAKWNGTSWSALATGLDGTVMSMAFAPNGDLYIGGSFPDLGSGSGKYLTYWDGSAFNPVGTVELSGGTPATIIRSIVFDAKGSLIVGGNFTNAGGVANADYIAKWNGSVWESLGTGTNGDVYDVFVRKHDGSITGTKLNQIYASGYFTVAGGLTLTDRVAVWSNGAWQPLDIDLPGTSTVYAVLPASDGSLYIGGNFSTTDTSENAETGIVALNLNVSSASANTYPYMQVRGPGTLKAITNYSTGKTIAFDGLTLNAGETISLKFDPLDLEFKGGWKSRGNLMRYVVPGSDYGDFYLKPGDNLISLFFPDSDENLDSGAWIAWTPLFWGIDGALL